MRTRLGYETDAGAIREGARAITTNVLETVTKKWVTCMIRRLISAKRNRKKQGKRLEVKRK